MLNRNYNLKLDLQFRCNNPNMEFNQFDKNTSDFFIQINRGCKKIDLSKALVTLMVIKPNGNVDSQFLEVAENGVYANLKPSLKDIPGDYQCRAIITTKDETVIPDQIFTYTVNEDKFLTAFNQNMTSDEDYSLLTDILGRLSTVETDEEQRQINEAERILKEEARQVAENKRVEAELVREHNDADREKAEATRETSEHDRQLAENTRNSNESKRIENENARVEAETKRVEAENVRNENYEFMTSDEERRRNEENQRIKDEKLRVEAEKARVNEESRRRTTEQARVLKENERNSKETERESNEVARKSNEEKRVQSETTRSDRYNVFINDAENTVNNFKAYTSTAKQEEETRKANEIARIDMENKRNSNETQRISDENTRKDSEDRRVEAETNRQSKFNSKVSEVNRKIVEVTAAKDAMIADTREVTDTMKKDVANAIAAGTNDLEVKEARKDINGVVHDTLKQRLKSDLTIDNKSLKDFVVDMNNMKEFQDLEYKSDTGYLVCKDTRNGVVKDMKVYGESLVNILGKYNFTNTTSVQFGRLCKSVKEVEQGQIYTLICETNNNIDVKISNITIKTCLSSDGKVVYKFKALSKGYIEFICLVANVAYNTNAIILKGDHTQNPPPFFESIASVGTGADKIEVLSQQTSENLIDLNNSYTKYTHLVGVEGDTIVCPDDSKYNDIQFYVFLEKGKEYTFNSNPSLTRADILKGINKGYVADHLIQKIALNTSFVYGGETGYQTFHIPNFRGVTSNITLVKGNVKKPNAKFKQDKKPILFKDVDNTWKPIIELRGINNTLCDSVEDSKYNKVLDCIILDETLNYTIWKPNPNAINTIIFSVANLPTKRGSQYSPITNLIASRIGIAKEPINTFKDLDKEGVGYWDSTVSLFVSINKSQLETPDVAGFKKLLKKWKDEGQSLKVIYEKESHEQYEANPLEVESFDNETMISFRYGVIAPYTSWKITSYLPNFVRNLANQVKQLQEQVYKTNLANFTVALNTLDTKLRLEQLTKTPR